MANSFQNAGATQEPSPSAPLYTSRMFTGWYTNRSPLQDGVTPYLYDKMGYGRQDSILDGQNMEITPRLTLARRAGTSAWGAANSYNRINRFYSFNTFTLTTEVIRVMADTATQVYDTFDGSIKNLIFTKSPGASSTYFLGLGNTLYFTNGVDNKQATFNPATGAWQAPVNWGIAAPATAPRVSQNVRPDPYQAWSANTVFSSSVVNYLVIQDSNGNMQLLDAPGVTGSTEPVWNTNGAPGQNVTQDGSASWQNMNSGTWVANMGMGFGRYVSVSVNTPSGNIYMTFACTGVGVTGPTPPNWPSGIGISVNDGTTSWINMGNTLNWTISIGANSTVSTVVRILDPNGYVQACIQPGKTGSTIPVFSQEVGAYSYDGQGAWVNQGAFAVGATAAAQYGYEFMKSAAPPDLSNMSPKSNPIVLIEGNQIIVSGNGSTDPQVDKIVIFRTAQGGSTFFYLDQISNPSGGGQWTYTDTTPDALLNTEWQAQIAGEGTPLPVGATCLAYHLGRIFAAVGNVVWASAGPDAIVGGSSGNAGFAISFTCQSKVTRLWPTSIGLIVFTVRDAYVILGNGVDVSVGGTGLYIKVWIENLPLLNYDAFTTFGTTAFLYTGKNMVISLDPGAGIVEVSQPIADVLETLDPRTAYLTYHSHNSRDTALYLGNGQDTWYRLNPNIAPESGFAWSLPAYPVMGMSALQSVEVTPGVYQLLMGPKTNGGGIFYRNTSTRQDNGASFPAYADFGVITLAQPGQLAGIAWMNLEAWNTQNEPQLSMLMGELMVSPNTPLEPVKRTRHDPPNLPQSTTLDSTRYSFLRGGSPIWCRHLIFRADFGTNSTFDELLSFTIFGATYQEVAA